MWIVEYFSSHLQTIVKRYFSKQATAQEAYRQVKFSNRNVTLTYDPAYGS